MKLIRTEKEADRYSMEMFLPLKHLPMTVMTVYEDISVMWNGLVERTVVRVVIYHLNIDLIESFPADVACSGSMLIELSLI